MPNEEKYIPEYLVNNFHIESVFLPFDFTSLVSIFLVNGQILAEIMSSFMLLGVG